MNVTVLFCIAQMRSCPWYGWGSCTGAGGGRTFYSRLLERLGRGGGQLLSTFGLITSRLARQSLPQAAKVMLA